MGIDETEPSAEWRVFASNMRQMFVALMKEGFTERQALAIIGQGLAAAASQMSNDDDEDGHK